MLKTNIEQKNLNSIEDLTNYIINLPSNIKELARIKLIKYIQQYNKEYKNKYGKFKNIYIKYIVALKRKNTNNIIKYHEIVYDSLNILQKDQVEYLMTIVIILCHTKKNR